MPTFVFGVLLFQVPNVLGVDVFSATLRLSLLILIFIGTFGVPALLIYYLYRSGYVQTLHLTTLADRRLPFFLTALIYTFLTFLFAFRMELVSTVAPEIAVLLGSISLSILLIGIISLYWQISAHSVGMSGVVGILAGILLKFSQTELFIPVLLSVLLTGFVGSARLKLNAHTPAQIGVGVALGLCVSLVAVLWLV
ncbi:phosphatase PAP2 family protein [Spirosoma arcticum]